MFKQLSIYLLFSVFTVWQGTAHATEAVPVPLGELPASYTGVLPCASCEGIETRITLREDQTYFMTQTYLGMTGPNQSTDLGKWVMSHFGNVVVMKGQSGDTRYFKVNSPNELRQLDLEARSIISALNYSLKRSAAVEPLNLKIFPLNGMYRYMADAGRFMECASGIEFPVAQLGDNAKLEKAYLEQRTQPNQAVYASIYGQIKMFEGVDGAGAIPMIHPLRFEFINSETRCPAPLQSASLRDQFWKLVQLNGKPVILPESRKAPGITLHAQNNRLSGSGGCNQLLGTYAIDANSLQTNLLAATKMACLDGGNTEQEFMNMLTQVKTWNILGQRLEVYDQLGNVLARFEQQD